MQPDDPRSGARPSGRGTVRAPPFDKGRCVQVQGEVEWSVAGTIKINGACGKCR
jgi:hypothetical protein